MKTKKTKSKKTLRRNPKAANLRTMSANEIFLNTLREMGKPSLVRDMAVKLENGKLISKSKAKLMALLYASASHLNRDGVIKRTPVNDSMYKYSLPEWRKNGQKLKMAA
jgi:hypothetical protein